MTDDPTMKRGRELVAAAQDVVVMTGAGISTDSGIPDFRGPQGVWTKNPAAEKQSTFQNYVADGEVRKRAWQGRLAMRAWEREANDGHRALLALERAGKLHTLVTQNVDGLHQKAGISDDKMVEIHGTVLDVVCLQCDARGPMLETLRRVEAGEEDPACLACGGMLKSATISFGQGLIAEDLRRAEQAALGCDLMIAIGSTLSVFPAAAVVPLAKQAGAAVIIINGEPTEMDELADVLLRGPIGELVPALLS